MRQFLKIKAKLAQWWLKYILVWTSQGQMVRSERWWWRDLAIGDWSYEVVELTIIYNVDCGDVTRRQAIAELACVLWESIANGC